tara:strand:- start:1150 stop:1992 length:843 start_codon:yes stop_codon:yes gene_type:complete
VSDNKSTLIGSHPERSILWMQVKKGSPQMKCIDGLLRPNEYPEKGNKVLIGDVVSTLIKISGPHDSIQFTNQPSFDEQRWSLEIISSELVINIDSLPYWGFGLFSSCYVNKVRLEGSLIKRAKLIFDLVAALGRNPWEPKFTFFWEKATKNKSEQHRNVWLELLNFAKKGMEEEIEEINSRYLIVEKNSKETKLFPPDWNQENSKMNLKEVKKHIEIAKQALHDQNAVGLKRALDRAEAKLIEADPLVGLQNEELLQNQNLKTLDIENIPFIDLVNDDEE